MKYVLAVDAGGTKADYALAVWDAVGARPRVLARFRTPTIKRMRTDAETAASHIEAALLELTKLSGVAMDAIAATCIGTAGNTVPLVHTFLTTEFSRRVAGKLLVVNDVEIALDAAFFGQAGVLVLAGTGSNVAGRSLNGTIVTAGGWGPALADQGSGHRIGLIGLRAAFVAIDREQWTALLAAIQGVWGLDSIDAMVEYANRIPPPDFSQLTPVVVCCAREGDAVALEVLQKEASALAELAGVVVRRLQRAAGASGWTPPVAFAGSIFEHIGEVRSVLSTTLEEQFPGIRILPGVVDPLSGALWQACRLLMVTDTDTT